MRLFAMMQAIDGCPAPVVARIQGYALGGGSGLAAAVDIAIAAEDAIFGFSEVKLGIIPAVISPFVLPKIGEGAARRYFLTGERFDAADGAPDRARQRGRADDLDGAVDRVVGELLTSGPQAAREAKRLVRDPASGRGDRAVGGADARKRRGPGRPARLPGATQGRLAGLTLRVRRLLLLVGGIVFVDTMFFAALTPLLPDYGTSSISRRPAPGVLAGAYPLGALVGGLPGGIAAARFGARPTAIAGLLDDRRDDLRLRDRRLDRRARRLPLRPGSSGALSPGPRGSPGSPARRPPSAAARRSAPPWRRRSSGALRPRARRDRGGRRPGGRRSARRAARGRPRRLGRTDARAASGRAAAALGPGPAPCRTGGSLSASGSSSSPRSSSGRSACSRRFGSRSSASPRSRSARSGSAPPALEAVVNP